jgi:hypothetical protein
VNQEVSGFGFVDNSRETVGRAVAQRPLDTRKSQKVGVTLNERFLWEQFGGRRNREIGSLMRGRVGTHNVVSLLGGADDIPYSPLKEAVES